MTERPTALGEGAVIVPEANMFDAPTSRECHPGPTARVATTGAVLLAAALCALCFSVVPASGHPAPPSLELDLGAAQTAPPDFWGLNLAGDKPQGPNATGLIGATPTTTLVYPSGNLTEKVNLTTGTIYNLGSTSRLQVTIQQFVADCEAIMCHAIIGLPMEANDSSTDAYEANFIVNGLGFHPAYFAFGNEPANWDCFGTPWAELVLGSCSDRNATPEEFASETEVVVSAVRALLGAAAPPVMCLGGSGRSTAAVEVEYVQALLNNSYDRTECVAFAMHAYPASSHTLPVTLSNFYGSLLGPFDPAVQYANASGATDGKPLFMTEVGDATHHSPFIVFAGTWPWDVLASAVVVQSMQSGFPDMGWWAWNTGDAQGLYDNGTTALYSIFRTAFAQLGPTWYASGLRGQEGVFAEATSNQSGWSLLVVNTNITHAFTIEVGAVGVALSGCPIVREWTAAGESASPACGFENGLNVSSQSVVLLTALRSTSPSPPLPPGEYYAIFGQVGLASGTSWTVSLNGTQETANASSISFTVPNGTYAFSVAAVPGFPAPVPGSGVVSVDGASIDIPIHYVEVYSVVFTESVLPAGTNWSVTLTGGPDTAIRGSAAGSAALTLWSNGQSVVQFYASNGTYAYATFAEGFPGSNGAVTVAGGSPGAVAVAFGSTGGPWSAGAVLAYAVLVAGLVTGVFLAVMSVRTTRAEARAPKVPDP